MINRIETLDNKLSVISKYNPVVAEKYQEVSDIITTFKEINKGLKPDALLDDYTYPIICNILKLIGYVLLLMALPFRFIIDANLDYGLFPKLYKIAYIPYIILETSLGYWFLIMILLCYMTGS